MDDYWWSVILFRILLPLVIGVAIFIRPSITSYVYLVVGCYMPFFSVPTKKSMAKETGTYLKVLIITCLLTTTFLISFYMAVFFPEDNLSELEPCTTVEIALRTLGVINFHGLSVRDLIPWCLPEPLMLFTSVSFTFIFKRLSQDETDVLRATKQSEDTSFAKKLSRRKYIQMMLHFGKYFVVFLCCFSAVLRATAFGAVYYLFFLIMITYWACNCSLGRVFAKMLACLIPIIFINITVIFWYQFQYFQDSSLTTAKNIWGRLFNLVDMKTYKDCNDPRLFYFHPHTLATYSVPVSLYVMYMLVVMVAKEILQAKDGCKGLFIAMIKRKPVTFKDRWAKAVLQIHEQKYKKESMTADKVKAFIEQTLQFIIYMSFIAANFVMMLWAIIYVGWITLVLMVWANVIWLMPFRKKLILYSSPLVVIWVWIILVISYLYSMNLSNEELPTRWRFVYLASGVDQKSKYKPLHLGTKSLFGVIIFVTMRQMVQEIQLKKEQKKLASAMGLKQIDIEEPKIKFALLERFRKWSLDLFATCWIWVVILTMIWLTFWTTCNVFSIVFVFLATVFITTFQFCPFKAWKKFLRVYWWIVIIYSMFNFFVVYLYQIPVTRNYMLKLIPEKEYRRLGFRAWKDPKKATAALAIPLFFQIAVVIQQHYLHRTFDRITSPTPPEEMAKSEDDVTKSSTDSKWKKVNRAMTNFKNNLFGILELRLRHIILIVGWFMCLEDMCALQMFLAILFTAACVLGHVFTTIVIYGASFAVQILIVLRLLYMNLVKNHYKWNYVGYYTRNGKIFNKTMNTADWLGFHESRYGSHYADFGQLAWCFLYVFMVTLNRVVSIRMRNYRISNNETKKPGVLYPLVTYENCHENFKIMAQFLVNYGFYKFGCEITLFFTTVVMMMCMDASSIFLAFWLLGVYSLNRNKLRIVWLPSLIIIAVSVPYQYWASLAWMPKNWNNSLTKFWNTNDFLLRIQQFCYFANMAHPPNKERISLKFILLFLISRQWRSFRREWKHKGIFFEPGGNDDVSTLIDDQNVENPVPDFVTYTRSYLDIIKRGIFNTWFYLTLGITFLCAILRLTPYSFGYIIITFIFSWEGTDMYLRPPKVIKKRWNILIAYNIFVMIVKTSSQVFGCIFNYSNYIPFSCRTFQFFSVGCVDNYHMTEGVPNLTTKQVCLTDYKPLDMELDCLCFFFLIVQQRIFKSFHFFHLVNEAKAQTILADRGAQFIECARREKRIELDQNHAQIKKNIDLKLAKIRATHEKVQGEVYQRRLKNHSLVLKSCDYYMFDDKLLAEDIPIIPPKKDTLQLATNCYDPQNLTQYFGLWHLTDVTTVLAERALRRQQKAAILAGQNPEDVSKMVRIPDTEIPETTAARIFKKFVHFMIFIWGFVESFIVSLTTLFNQFTKGFRSTLTDMYKDSVILKEKTKYNEGERLGSQGVWEPTSSFTDILGEVAENTDPDSDPNIIKFTIYEKLVSSLWYLIWSHTEWICYFIIICIQMIRATFISLPLVMLTFCWGSLTVPKPSRTYWVLNIAYVLVVLLLKCFMPLRLAPWYYYHNLEVFDRNHYFPPYSMGVGDNTTGVMNFALFFTLLVAFLCHRMVLQSLGLWNTIHSRPTNLVQNGFYNLQDGRLVPASPRRYSFKTLDVATAKLGVSELFPNSILKGFGKYGENFKIFIQELITPSMTQNPVDVYTPMFLCDLVNLILIVFFYGPFHGANKTEGLITFIQTNTVPLSFIVLILGYFLLMVIDRAIYLKKNRFAKLVFHFFQVFSVHIYFFVLFPLLGEFKFKQVPVAQIFYFFKCLYFLFSAYQIRNGYPPLISFHFLWHGLGVVNRYGYKFYRMVPYFFEMRTLLDWICSDSSLSVSDWFKMEEIIQNIFDQMCQQSQEGEESDDPSKRARRRTKKYIKGGFLYFLLILTVIFPFLLFSLGDTVGVKTHPTKFKLELYMGSAEPIFQSYASQKSLRVMSDRDYQNLTGTFNNIEESEEIFDTFRSEDVVVVTWSPNSLTDWTVSPGAYKELVEDILADDIFNFRMEIQYTHIGNGGVRVQSTFGQSSQYPPLPNVHRQNLINILQLNQSLEATVWIPLIFPKFLLIDQKATPHALTMGEQTEHHIYDEYVEDLSIQHQNEDDDVDVASDPRRHRNVLATLKIDNGRKWWHIKEECDNYDDNYYYYLKDLVHNKCNNLVMYTFNERVFSDSMSFITSSGIIGLYLLYFMLVIGIIRDCRIVISQIWIEDLPNSELIYRKCLEVYVARDMQNYELEEELFAELIFIMRSRELMIKLTRYTDSTYNPPIPVKAKSPKGKSNTVNNDRNSEDAPVTATSEQVSVWHKICTIL